MVYGPLMPQSLPDIVAERARDIADVANDLTRELVRAQVVPGSALLDMAVFIQTEAEQMVIDIRGSETIRH
jgi:hypothetical protein